LNVIAGYLVAHDLSENRFPLFGIMLDILVAHDLSENRFPLFGIML